MALAQARYRGELQTDAAAYKNQCTTEEGLNPIEIQPYNRHAQQHTQRAAPHHAHHSAQHHNSTPRTPSNDGGSSPNRGQGNTLENSPTLEAALATDAPYKAVASMFVCGDSERKAFLDSLVTKCYKTYGSGFKDSDTLFGYLYQIEDGIPLSSLEIQNKDVAPQNQGNSRPPTRAAQVATPGHSTLAGPPPSVNRMSVDGPPPSVNRMSVDGPPPSRGRVVTDGPPPSRGHMDTDGPSTGSVRVDGVPPKAVNSKNNGEQGGWKKSEFTCKVCLDQLISVTFVPCGHLVACVSCASALLECPVCRASIRGTIKTFF